MVVLDLPASIAEHVHKRVAGRHAPPIGEAEAVGPGVHGLIAAQLDAAAFNSSPGGTGQKACEVITDALRCGARLGREGGQEQGIRAVQRGHLIRIAAAKGRVPALEQGCHRRRVDGCTGLGRQDRCTQPQPEQQHQPGMDYNGRRST